MKVRIQKLLASAGFDSRRHVEEMVLAGRVAVNGKKVKTLPVLVNDEADTIEVDDVEVYAPRKAKRGEIDAPDDLVYVVMNKPEKVYCTNVAQGEQTRAIDLLPPHFRTRVYPVGRLDAESRGLLLLTNDGDLTNKLTHPKYGISKIYRAIVDGAIEGTAIQQLVHGVWLADPGKGQGFKAKAAKVEVIKRTRERSVIDITLEEGRNRQVRRMLAKAGHKVRTLTRIRFGPLDLNKLGLQPGDSRLLMPREVTALKRAAERGVKREETGDVAANRDLTPKQRREKAEATGRVPKVAKPGQKRPMGHR
jgi:23S rRNA pseudouridine2605 synthase